MNICDDDDEDDGADQLRRGVGVGIVLSGLLWALLAGLVLSGCSDAGTATPQAQRVVDVLCERDAALQPIVVPVVATAAPATGPAAPVVAGALAADQLLIHPAVVAACARYASKPAGVVAVPPAGATVVAPVAVTVAPKP